LKISDKNLGIQQNVTIKVIDQFTGKVVQEHEGHNTATNSMLTGIAHYLIGDGVLNQGYHMLNTYVPKYISLGTMGLYSQEEDDNGLPLGIGVASDVDEETNFTTYMNERPGYGADGYDPNENNNRVYMGLGPKFIDRADTSVTVNCELISDTFPRTQISYRDIVPETEAELPKTVDVVFSALISTGALAQFREEDKDYIFITEAGLWSSPNWIDSGDNGLLAAYRLAPSNEDNWDMTDPTNRDILKQNILRVGVNQIVQVVWKLQLGSIDQFGGRLPSPETPDIASDVVVGTVITENTVTNLNVEVSI